MKYEIVMFNMSNFSEWEKGITNRNYQVFAQLTRNKNVGRIVLIDYLPFTLKRTIKNYLTDILPAFGAKDIVYKDSTSQCRIIQKENPQIYHLSTIDSWVYPDKMKRKIERILELISNPSLLRIVWSYFPMDGCFLKIKNDLTVFDAVDNWMEHSSYEKQKKELEKNYKIIAQKTDVIFTVAQTLKDFFAHFGREKDVYSISNGVNYNHFQQEKILFDEKFGSIPHPIIGYVGVISWRLDFDLIEYLAKEHPQKMFVFIGPCWPRLSEKIPFLNKYLQKIKKYKNVYFLGPRAYQDVPYYMKHFDVAIIPHKFSHFIQYTSSLKLLEYLACGLPAVSLPVSGAEKFKDIVYLASDYPTFSRMIDTALKEDISLSSRRQKAAEKEDWKYKIEQMMNIINKKIKH